MKKIIFLILISCSPRFIDAQTNYTDSLKQQLLSAKNDTSKIIILSQLCSNYTWSIPDSAFLFAQQELRIAKKIKSATWEALALSDLGGSLYVTGNYPSALDYTLQALTLAEKIHDTTTFINCFYGLGSLYRDIGDFKHALYYSFRGKSITEKLSDKNAFILSLGIIGSIYDKSDQIDSAFIYLNKASQLDSVVNGKLTRGFIQYALGNIYNKKENYPLAIEYYRKSIDLAISSNIRKDLMDSWNGIIKTFLKTGQVDSAIFYSSQVLLEGRTTAYPFGSLEASSVLSDIYRSQNMLDSSAKYNGIAVSIKDSIFNKERITQFQNLSFSEDLRKQEIDAAQSEYVNKVKIYILSGGLAILVLMAVMLLRNNRHKQKAYALLQKQKQEIDTQKAKVEETLEELRNTQAQLIQSEKMASLGELTAGIAHEIQNPLNFVNNFSDVNKELLVEMKEEISKGNLDDANDIANDVIANEEKINHHGKRADAIVKGMLQHSQTSTGKKEATNINALCDEYLRLAYHGLRAKDKGFNATMKTDYDDAIGKVNIIPQDMGRVILNLITNAFYAVNEKTLSAVATLPTGQADPTGIKYEPTVSISTKKINDKVEIKVADNGNGIPQKILEKIFQPFFTTKPTGQGTGLGLSLSYDIVKAHGGELKVETKENEETAFIISLPINK